MSATAAGQVATYVDPHPGLKGTDKVTEPCGRCCGDGVVHYGNVRFATRKASGRVCFACLGEGSREVLVSSVRARIRRQVKAANEAAAKQADFVENELPRIEAERANVEAAFIAAQPEFADHLAANENSLEYYQAHATVESVRCGSSELEGSIAWWKSYWGFGWDRVITNRRAGKCDECGTRVAREAGFAAVSQAKPWTTFCAEHKPEEL